MEPVEFSGFVGPSYRARLIQSSCEECINLFPETLETENAKPRFILRGTPGSATAIEGMHGKIRAQFQQDGRAFAVDSKVQFTNAQLYETTTGVAVALGDVADDGSGNPVYIDTNGSQNGAGGHQLLVCASGHGYTFDLNTNTFAEVTSAGWPVGKALQVLYFDSFFLVLTAAFIGQSGFEDGDMWNALARGSREFTNDNNVAFINNYALHTLVILGSKRGEIWVDTGASTFAFAPIQSPGLNVGCAAAGTLKRFNESVAWLGVDEHGTRIVFALNGYQPVRLSQTAVEYDLSQCPDVADFVAWTYQEEGHEFYVLTSVANQRTWVYDGKEKLWHKRQWRNPNSGIPRNIRGWNHIVSPSGTHWVGDWENGTIYTQSLNLYDDAGAPLVWTRQFPHLLAQNRRVFYGGLELQAAQGLGLATGQGSDPQVSLSWSDDGGNTFSNSYTRSLGRQGKYGNRTYWQNLGSGRNRVFRLTGSDPTPRGLFAAYFSPPPVAGSN